MIRACIKANGSDQGVWIFIHVRVFVHVFHVCGCTRLSPQIQRTLAMLAFFRTLPHRARRTLPYGLLWMGPPCKSWVWMARHSFGRSVQNIAGDPRNAQTVYHNKIGSFVGKAIMAATACGVYVVVEQPQSSWLFNFEPVRRAVAACKLVDVVIKLGHFGGGSPKPLRLVGNVPWFGKLAAAQPLPCERAVQPLVHRWATGVRGLPEVLAASALYPPDFCETVASLHLSHLMAVASENFHVAVICRAKFRSCVADVARRLQKYLHRPPFVP